MKVNGVLRAEPGPGDMIAGRVPVSSETSAFDQLYRQHCTYVYNTCFGILGNREDARDAMQDTFVRLHHHLPKLRGECSITTWLYRVAVNRCTDMLRRRRRYVPTDSLEQLEGPGPSWDDRLTEQQVRQTILKLKPEHRAVIVLFHFQQLGYAEIAEVLRCSIDQVRARLHRARKAFRVLYEDGGGDVEV